MAEFLKTGFKKAWIRSLKRYKNCLFYLLALYFILSCNVNVSKPSDRHTNLLLGSWIHYKRDSVQNLIWDIKDNNQLNIIYPNKKNIPCNYWVEKNDSLKYLLIQPVDSVYILKYDIIYLRKDELIIRQLAYRRVDPYTNKWKETAIQKPYNVFVDFKK